MDDISRIEDEIHVLELIKMHHEVDNMYKDAKFYQEVIEHLKELIKYKEEEAV